MTTGIHAGGREIRTSSTPSVSALPPFRVGGRWRQRELLAHAGGGWASLQCADLADPGTAHSALPSKGGRAETDGVEDAGDLETRGAKARLRVKICGVRSIHDALLAVDLGADLLGLNFFARSPRYLEVEVATDIAHAVRDCEKNVKLVGVFVRAGREEIRSIDEAVGLDLLQFHGDEEPEDLAPFGERAIKVWRWGGRPSAAELARFSSAWGFLLDRNDRTGGLYGGTGEAWDYAEAVDLPTPKPVLLAGGVGPSNVRAAVAAARPWGIDVCSRVESAPGVKDRALLEALFREIRDGEAQPA